MTREPGEGTRGILADLSTSADFLEAEFLEHILTSACDVNSHGTQKGRSYSTFRDEMAVSGTCAEIGRTAAWAKLGEWFDASPVK